MVLGVDGAQPVARPELAQGDQSGHNCSRKGYRDRQEMVRPRICNI